VYKRQELGTIEGGTNKKLYFSWINIVNLLTTLGGNDGPIVTLSIKVQLAGSGTDYYLSGTATKNSWSTTPTDRVTVTLKNVHTGFEKLYENVSLISQSDIPTATHTDCEIVVVATLTWANGSFTAGATDFEFYMDHMAVSLSDGENFTSNVEYSVNNPSSTDNSTVLDFGALSLSDEGIITNLNAIEVDNAGTWQQSSTWTAGFGANVSLTKTIVHEAIALQRLPVKKLLQTVVGDYYAHLTVQYGSNTYVLNGGTYDIKNDEFNGEWFKVILNKTSIQTDKTRKGVEPGFGKIPSFNSAPKKFVDKMDDFKDYSHDLTTSTDSLLISGSPYTSISINAVGYAQIKNGDKLKIWDPQTQEIVTEVTVTADVTDVATSISVTSFITPADIPAGAQITHLPRELVTATCGRFDTVKGETIQGDTATELQRTITSNTTLTNADNIVLADSSGGPFTITLPAASTMYGSSYGQKIIIVDVACSSEENPITIQRAGSDTINDTAAGGIETVLSANGFELTFRAISTSKYKVT
jgi:hypothetical protein